MPFKWSGEKKQGKKSRKKKNHVTNLTWHHSQCKRQYIQWWWIKTEGLSMCHMHCRCKASYTQNLHNRVQFTQSNLYVGGIVKLWFLYTHTHAHTHFLRPKTLFLNIGSFIKYCVMLQRQYVASKIKYWSLYFQTKQTVKLTV